MDAVGEILLNGLGIIHWQKRPLVAATLHRRENSGAAAVQSPSNQSMPGSSSSHLADRHPVSKRAPSTPQDGARQQTQVNRSVEEFKQAAASAPFRLWGLRFANACVLYLSDDNPAAQDLVERMFVKCGARPEDIKRVDLRWPPANSFSVAGYVASSPAAACQGFLDGMECSLAVIMGEETARFVRPVKKARCVYIDGVMDLLQHPLKRKTAWQELAPLREELEKQEEKAL